MIIINIDKEVERRRSIEHCGPYEREPIDQGAIDDSECMQEFYGYTDEAVGRIVKQRIKDYGSLEAYYEEQEIINKREAETRQRELEQEALDPDNDIPFS